MAVAGPDPWSGDWEQVNIQYALEVLEQCDLDLDPVPSELKDAVLTMELPTRLLRYWADSATHPLIKNFKVSEAELEKEQKIQAKLMEEAEKLNLQLEPKVKRKGLAGSVNDLRSIGRALVNSPEASNMMSGMQKYMNEGATGPRMSVPDIQDRLTASGRVYLFRYIDFDVLPGMAYRYRLKLELKNPNLDRPYEEVEDQAVTKGVYRHTGWSNISTPTVVPDTVHYYLKDVERDPVRDEKHSRKPVANIALFKWDADFGTTLFDTLKILNVGQFVSEKKKTWVLDPGTPTYEEKEVALATEDMLVDASGDQELQPELHPDLQLRPERGRKDVKVGMLQEALVVTDAGELKTLDPYSKIGEERDLKRRVDEERKNFLYLKDAPTQTSSALDGPAAAMAQMMGISQPPGRAANPRQKKGAGGPSGGHGSQEGPPTPGPGGRSTPPAGRGARTGRGGGA